MLRRQKRGSFSIIATIPTRNVIRIVTLFLVLAFAIVIYQTLHLEQWLSPKSLASNIDTLRELDDGFGSFGPAVFFALASVAIVLNVPTAFIIAIAAVLYGAVGATIIGTFSFSLAIILMYIIAKTLDKGITKRIVKKYMPRTSRYICETDLHAIICLRLIFFALPPINWMLAILCTQFSTYFWGSLIGALPNIVAFSWLGGTFVDVIQKGRSIWFWNTPELIAPTVLGIFLTVCSVFLRKKQLAQRAQKNNN